MYTLFDRLVRFLTRASYLVAIASALAMMVVGGLDVIGTRFFGKPLPSALELQEVLLALMVFLGFAHVQHLRGHIVVDVVVTHLSARTRRGLELIVLLLSGALFAVISWRTGALAMASIDIRETARASFVFPIYPIKALAAIGAGLAALECLRQAFCWFRNPALRSGHSASLH